ncbi:MAG: MFS transporter [Acidobacteriales bacterium]|nr:MFS transporter [Terriglobales bacterium]
MTTAPMTTSSIAVNTAAFAKDDRRNIFGWCMYDWANSAYVTTVTAGLLPAYFARVVVGPEGVTIAGTTYSAFTLWGFIIGLSALISLLIAPVLGAIADFSAAKKRFLLVFAYLGALFTVLLYFSRSGDVYQTLFFFLLAQIAFVSANVFSDAFLPQISSESKMDWISGKGYSYGYVGGGLQFAIALALVAGHEKLGISQAQAVRIGIVTAGLWWAGFTLFTARYLQEPRLAEQALPEAYRNMPRPLAFTLVGITRTLRTTMRAGRFRHLALFLIAFMLYNDGIQTVIDMASIYGAEELKLSTTALMLTLLMVQAVATLGALLFGRIAERIGTKRAIMLSLVLWSGVVIYAYFIGSATEYFILGGVVGVVLGGSQALSRSFYGLMIPENASAEFYGFYTVFSKFSAIWGPFTLAFVRHALGSARLAIASLIFFFLAGLVLLYFVDERKAREAKLAGAF